MPKKWAERCTEYLDNEARTRTTRLRVSTEVDWASLLVEHSQGRDQEPFDTAVTPDPLLCIVLRGFGTIEEHVNGRRRSRPFDVGSVNLNPGGGNRRLGWRMEPESQPYRRMFVFLPGAVVGEAADHFRKPGLPAPEQSISALAVQDGTVLKVGRTLLSAMYAGAPDIYAEATAQWLAVHLLAFRSGSGEPADDRRPGTLQDPRLARAIEFMRTNLHAQISLEQIAAEAGVSRFHFTTLFRRRTGRTPIRFLFDQRLARAAALLAQGEMSVKAVAYGCGFRSIPHFNASFRRRYGMSPTVYRDTSA